MLLRSILTARLEPPAAITAERDTALEGLRGAAALAVLYAHITAGTPLDGGGRLDPRYIPAHVWSWFEGGTLAVLAFFLLSGHVIGLSLQRPFTAVEVPAYLRRRAVRVLPIYLVAVAFGLVLSPGFLWRDALGHLLFLQNDGPASVVQLLPANPNLWSLPYEAAFYLGFPLLWAFRPRLIVVLLWCFILCALGTFDWMVPHFLSAIAGGAVFWIIGLAIAWLPPSPSAGASEQAPWPTVLLLALVTWKLDPVGLSLTRFGISLFARIEFDFRAFATLPVLAWLLLIVARRAGTFLRSLEVLCWSLPVVFLLWRVVRGTWEPVLGPICLLAGAALLRPWHPSLTFWRWLAPIGAISYGVYALGYPAQVFVRSLLPEFAGHALTWGLRALLLLLLTFAGAWWLECRLQPRLRALFR